MLFAPVAVKEEKVVRGSVIREFGYNAVLKKKEGRISPHEFLYFTRRFIRLCNEIYKESRITLGKNRRIPTVIIGDCGEWSMAIPGKEVELSQTMSEQEFVDAYSDAMSLVITICPLEVHEDKDFSHASIQWVYKKPSSLFFKAQQGPIDKPIQVRTPLHDLLLQNMFHVPGQPPSREFSVLYGSTAYGLELEGHFYPQQGFLKTLFNFIW